MGGCKQKRRAAQTLPVPPPYYYAVQFALYPEQPQCSGFYRHMTERPRLTITFAPSLACVVRSWSRPTHIFFSVNTQTLVWNSLLAAQRFAVYLPPELWTDIIFPFFNETNLDF